MKKERFQLEFSMNTSPKILFYRLSNPDGLSEWFADDVYVNEKNYTFVWENSEQKAELVQNISNQLVEFKWLDDDDPNAYFSFEIKTHELTGDVALIITDFAEDEDEKQDAINLWEAQIAKLKHRIGI